MEEKDIQVQKPYTEEELAELGLVNLGGSYAGYHTFEKGNFLYMLDTRNTEEGTYVLRTMAHRFTK